VIGITLYNGWAPQFAPSLQISAGPNLVILKNEVTLKRGNGNNEPLVIAGFLSAFIQQSNSSASAPNTLFVKIATYSHMPVINPALPTGEDTDTRITISGISGIHSEATLQMPVTQVPRQHANQIVAYPVFGKYAVWNATQRTLMISLAQQLEANTIYNFSLSILNSATGQVAPALRVSCHEIGMRPVLMTQGAGNFAPLLIAGFIHKGVGQSSRSTPTKITKSSYIVILHCTYMRWLRLVGSIKL